MPTHAAGALPPLLLPAMEAPAAPAGDPVLFEQLLGAAVGRDVSPAPAVVSAAGQELLETLPLPEPEGEAPAPTGGSEDTPELPRWVPPSGEWTRPAGPAPTPEAGEFHVPTEPTIEPARPTMKMAELPGSEDVRVEPSPEAEVLRPAAIDGAPALVVQKSKPGAPTPTRPAFDATHPRPELPRPAVGRPAPQPNVQAAAPEPNPYVADAPTDATVEAPAESAETAAEPTAEATERAPAVRLAAPRFRSRVRPAEVQRVDGATADAPMTTDAVEAPEGGDLPDGLRAFDAPEFEHQGSFKLAGLRGARVSVDLGDGEVVRAKVSVAEGEVDVHLRATDEAASRAERRLGELKEALDEKGLKLARFTVDAEEQERREKDRRQRRQKQYDHHDEARGGFFNRRA